MTSPRPPVRTAALRHEWPADPHDGTDVDAEDSFATGPDRVLDGVAARLVRPSV